MSGRRGTFGASIDVSGSSATHEDRFGAAGSCVAGVTLSAPQPRFAWQAWYFRYLHRCQRKLGDEWGLIWRRWILRGRRNTFSTSASICVAGVVLPVPPYMSAEARGRSYRSAIKKAWYRLFLHLTFNDVIECTL